MWFWIRVYYLPVPALMLEPVGVMGALGRGFRLTRRQFWRTFGIALLTVVIAQVAGSMLSLPISLLGQGVLLGAGSVKFAVLAMVLTNALRLRRGGCLRRAVHHHGRVPAVPRPADAQGGVTTSSSMTRAGVTAS